MESEEQYTPTDFISGGNTYVGIRVQGVENLFDDEDHKKGDMIRYETHYTIQCYKDGTMTWTENTSKNGRFTISCSLPLEQSIIQFTLKYPIHIFLFALIPQNILIICMLCNAKIHRKLKIRKFISPNPSKIRKFRITTST